MRLSALLLAGVSLASSAPRWTPFFDGKSLSNGWHIVGEPSYWSIDPADTSVVAYTTKRTVHSLVFTNKEYDQFTVRYAYKLKTGNSGFWFRSHEKGNTETIDGPQVEAATASGQADEAGSIWVWPQPGWAVQHSKAYSAKIVPKPGDYQFVILTVKKPYVYVNVNGHQAVGETDADSLAAGAKKAWDYTTGTYSKNPGMFALQVDGGFSGVDIRFKDIMILEGCGDPASPNYDGAFVPGHPKQPAAYAENKGCDGTAVAPALRRGATVSEGESFSLDGRRMAGKPANPGVYLVKMGTGVKRMLVAPSP